MVTFLFTCFFLGILAAAPLGPLCIIAFNRSARSGLWAGVVTGLGASASDGLYSLLGLSGMLQGLNAHPRMLLWLYMIGGVALCAMGVSLMMSTQAQAPQDRARKYGAMFLQGFLLTTLNPAVPLFFMTAGIQVLSYHSGAVNIWFGSAAVAQGSALVFVCTSVIGAMVGTRISQRGMVRFQHLTGFILCAVGAAMVTGLVSRVPALLSQISRFFS